MTEVFKIQTSLELGGNLAPETVKLLRRMEQIEARAKAIPRELVALERPLENANRTAERLARTLAQIRKGAGGQQAPANDIVRWASASAKELRDVRSETKGIGSAARGIGKAMDGWEGKINRATRALERMEQIANRMRFPEMPAAPRGGYGSGGGRSSRSGGSGSHGGSQRGGGGHSSAHGRAAHEGSAVAGLVGIGGGVHTAEATVEPGMEMVQISLGMKQAGATAAQIAHAKETAETASKAYPNLSTLEVFEHINDLRGIVGDMDKAVHDVPDILPIFAALKAKMGSKGGAAALREVYAAVKSAETANETTPEGIREHTTDLARLSFWYGDKLNPSKYFSAQKAAGQMLTLTSDRFRHGVFPALTQELDQRAGTQFSTAAAKVVAGLRMTGRGLTKADDYGLLDKSTVEYSNAGLVKQGAQFTNKALDGKIYDRIKDPDQWLYNVVMPRLAAGNKSTQSGNAAPGLNIGDKGVLLQTLGQIYTDKNAYAFFSELAAQKTKLEKDYKGFLGTSGDFTNYLTKSPNAAKQGAEAQANSLATALSVPSIPGIVENLARFNTGLATAAAFFEKHPLMAQGALGVGLGAVGGVGAAGATGLAMMGFGALPPIAIAVGAGATVTILGALIPWREIFGYSPKDLANGFDNLASGKATLDGKMPDLLKSENGSAIDAAKLKDGAGSIWDFLKRGVTSTWNAFGEVAEKGQAEQKKVAEGAKEVAAGARELGTAAPQAKSALDGFKDSVIDFMKKMIISEAVIGQISFNGGGGGGGLGGLIQRASFGGDGAIGTFNGKALPVDGGLGIGHAAAKADRAAYIRQAALRNGIDPEVALRVAQSEGFNKYVGDYGTSFGDWQLHFGGSGIRGMNSGGLGDVLRRRGINAKDPSTWKQQTDFAMEWAAKHGWGDWHGARRAGIGNRQGIGRAKQEPTRAPVQPYQRPHELQATLHTHLDGRKIAMNTTKHQFDGANGPATGASFADASELYPQV